MRAVVTGLLGAAAMIAAPLAAQMAPKSSANDPLLVTNARQPGVHVTRSGLQYRILKQGTGALPGPTDVALITYTGKLADGTIFDSSPQPLPLLIAKTVPGFAEGLRLTRKGSTVRLWIKPELGYGAKPMRDDKGNVVIPPNSVLVFDVTLIDSMPAAQYNALVRRGWFPKS